MDGSLVLRPHYLLEVDPERFIIDASRHSSVPEWAGRQLRMMPFVVVRRGLMTQQHIPIGVRGAERNQRWASRCQRNVVQSAIAPPQLRSAMHPGVRGEAIPALRSLRVLEKLWLDLPCPWGPGGSVGFELATGRRVATPESDLDIVIYAENPMTAHEAQALCAGTMNLAAVIDIRVETLECGFSLREYAWACAERILLRTPGGGRLGRDPWARL